MSSEISKTIPCKRVLNILSAVGENKDEIVELWELQYLAALGYVRYGFIEGSSDLLDSNIRKLKLDINQISNELGNLYLDYAKKRDILSTASMVELFLGEFHLGKVQTLKKELKGLLEMINAKEKEAGQIKSALLADIAKRDALNTAYAIMKDSFHLTPTGENFAGELRANPAFLDQPIQELKNFLWKIDENFRNQIAGVQHYIQGRKIPPVFLPYLMHLNQINLVAELDRFMINFDPYYSSSPLPEPLLFERMISALYSQLQLPANLKHKFWDIQIQLKNLISFTQKINPACDLAFKHFSQVLGMWALFGPHPLSPDQDLFSHPDIGRFFFNLRLLISEITTPKSFTNPYCDGLKFGKLDSPHDIMALIVLALSPDAKRFNYFIPKVNHGIRGSKYFASVLSVLPWSPELSWQLLRRAETAILTAQSVQFIPELLEYGLVLNLNPALLQMVGNVSMDFLKYWAFVIIPAIAGINLYSLDEEISDYVRERPLAYITNPRPYYYYHGYYYRRRYHVYHSYSGSSQRYRRGYLFSHRSASRSGGLSRGGYSSSRSGSRGRYSSLHHHTIG
jgi:hypothetical protein